jgi:enoyl-CoA hydratase/carnithine racemase
MSSPPQHVVFEVKDRIARIELARVEKRNALTADMYRALADALERADADGEVRAVLVHGRPDCFCSGNDLKDFLERDPHAADPPAHRFLRRIAEARKPIVAAVGGPAVGIGTTMLLHCDLVYAAPGTRFQLPFVSLGLVPEAASSLLLPLVAGYRRAAELMLLGQPFDADRALAADIVTAVVPEGELLERARAAAAQLAALPPAAVRLTKELLKRTTVAAVIERMGEEGRLFAERLASPEAKEAFTAFLEKRKPDFSRFG